MKCRFENREEPLLAKNAGQAKIITKRTLHCDFLKSMIRAVFTQHGDEYVSQFSLLRMTRCAGKWPHWCFFQINPQAIANFGWEDRTVGSRIYERQQFGCLKTVAQNNVEIRTRRCKRKCSRIEELHAALFYASRHSFIFEGHLYQYGFLLTIELRLQYRGI